MHSGSCSNAKTHWSAGFRANLCSQVRIETSRHLNGSPRNWEGPMPREATGELRPLLDGWEARITLEGRDRKSFQMPPLSEEEARKRCTLLAGLARRLR